MTREYSIWNYLLQFGLKPARLQLFSTAKKVGKKAARYRAKPKNAFSFS